MLPGYLGLRVYDQPAMLRCLLVSVSLVVGCGRISYDTAGGGSDGGTLDGGDSLPPVAEFPSNLPREDSWWELGKGTLVTGALCFCTIVDTDTGQIGGLGTTRPAMTGLDPESDIYFDVVSQGPDLPGLGVFVIGSLELVTGEPLFVVGDNALAILVAGDATIGAGVESGAGLQSSGGLDSGGASGALGSEGGGGGGFGGRGGDGAGGIAGGETHGSAALIPLVGGSRGGDGGGDGGAGGDAYQISALGTITVAADGYLEAGGSGGDSGGGGGGGGAILLEAPVVVVDGPIAANGGGGGGCGSSGAYPTASSMPATGGGGCGGDGAAGEVVTGGAGIDGGGGGGAGRIRINTESGSVDGAGTISPDASTGLYTRGTLPPG